MRHTRWLWEELRSLFRAQWVGERGQALAIVILGIFVLLGSVALATDGSNAYAQRRLAQRAADAAALAGMRAHLYQGGDVAVEEAVYKYAALNGLDPTNPDNLSWSYVDENGEHVGVMVTTTATFPTSFAGVFGYNAFSVSASAQGGAKYEFVPNSSFIWALFANNPIDDAIFFDGNDGIVESGTTVEGLVHSNGGIKILGNNNVMNGGTEALGTFYLDGNNNVLVAPVEVTEEGGYIFQGKNSYPVPVNTANYEEMPQYSLSDYGPEKPGWVFDSDWHYFDGDWVCNLTNQTMSGIYFVNGDLTFNGNNLVGQATFVATGSILVTGQHYSFVSYDGRILLFAGNGNIQIGDQNSNNMELAGIVYAPHGQVGINGNALSTPLAGSIIADTILIQGNSTRIVAFDPYYFGGGTTRVSIVLLN